MLEADACQPVERMNCLGMFRPSSLLPDTQGPLIQQFGLVVPSTFKQIVCRFPQHLGEVLVPSLIRYGGSTRQHVGQEALTLPPSLMGNIMKHPVERCDHPPPPLCSIPLAQLLAQHRLHHAMH